MPAPAHPPGAPDLGAAQVGVAAPRDVTGVVLEFARSLRHAGVDASGDRVAAMLSAVGELGVTRPRAMFWAGRLTLCASAEDIAVYDAAFAAYFGGFAPVCGLPLPVPPKLAKGSVPFGAPESAGDGKADGVPVALAASETELLRHRDIAELSAVERADVRRMIALLSVGTAPRRGRRRRPAARGEVDVARTVRRMLRAGGEPGALARRARRTKPRRLVLLLDVSGSMAPYADALLCLGHAAVRLRPRATEVFTLGTRLTRVTRALRLRDPDAAIRAAGAAIPDWHGGTRLAQALTAFLGRWGQRGMARGAVVVLCSDGWERGDPAPLGAAMRRLSLLAYRLVWVNPHAGRDGYQPLAGGMAAALPYVDDFVAGHSVAALAELAEVVSRA
jgi:uncharacterized protein